MHNNTEKIKNEIWNYFLNFQHIYLATSEGDQPRVRPVTLVYLDKRFWITTGTNDKKVAQIKENPKIEFCLPIKEESKEGYIRGTGWTKIVGDKEQRKNIAQHCDFFPEFWEGPDDPHFTLIEVFLEEIEYLKPDETMACRLRL